MKSVTVYTSSSCPWCVKAKKYLSAKGINYREINVSKDVFGAIELVRKSGQRGVPVLDIDGHVIIGFDREEIDRALKG